MKATPHRLGPGLVSASAARTTAALGDPTHGLAQRGGICQRWGTRLEGTRQRRSFLDLQQLAPRHRGDRPRQHGGIHLSPGHDMIERQTARQACTGAHLARFDTTAPVHKPLLHFHAPATCIPRDPFAGVLHRVDLHRAQQQPRHGLTVGWGERLHGPPRHAGQAFRSASAHSLTAQFVSWAWRRLIPDACGNGLRWGLLERFKSPTYPKGI